VSKAITCTGRKYVNNALKMDIPRTKTFFLKQMSKSLLWQDGTRTKVAGCRPPCGCNRSIEGVEKGTEG